MKKSKMVEILMQDLKDIRNWSLQRQAEFILASVKARGMLPPPYIGERECRVVEEVDCINKSVTIGSGIEIGEIFEWEDE